MHSQIYKVRLNLQVARETLESETAQLGSSAPELLSHQGTVSFRDVLLSAAST